RIPAEEIVALAERADVEIPPELAAQAPPDDFRTFCLGSAQRRAKTAERVKEIIAALKEASVHQPTVVTAYRWEEGKRKARRLAAAQRVGGWQRIGLHEIESTLRHGKPDPEGRRLQLLLLHVDTRPDPARIVCLPREIAVQADVIDWYDSTARAILEMDH